MTVFHKVYHMSGLIIQIWPGKFNDKQHVSHRQVFFSIKLTISVSLITVIVPVYSPHYMVLSVNLQPSGT